jgi:PadR family transcriptional regulator, regulatory protein PadR
MTSADPRPRKVSQPLLQVLGLLLSNPTRDDWYGLGIVRQLGLGSGTVTQILFRLKEWGWIVDHWEDEATARADGRPPRRFYRLTGAGELAARELIRERQSRIARLQHRGRMA